MIAKLVHLLLGLWLSISVFAQPGNGNQKLSVEERMAKARAAKAQKKVDRATAPPEASEPRMEKATTTDYKAPVDKVLKGPHGEVVHTGERGAKFYINKNGNKTYLSSNQ